jgi:glycine betaine/proline transport system ATP-binding protein
MQTPYIEMSNITKIFGKHIKQGSEMTKAGKSKDEIREKTGCTLGVNGVDLQIGKGELFVIMGLSGSGKSTLLRCINRLIEPTFGSIIIDGTDVTKLSEDELLKFRQKKMAMVFQKFALLPHRTVEENVAFGLELQNMPKAERLKIANEKLALVGLERWGKESPSSLSGGMQQRVGLARALANDPSILLMDEAFSALDPLIRVDMQDELLNLQSQLKKTIIFITHDLDEALRIGDRIALMRDGEVVQVGTPEEIVLNPANDYVARFVQGIDVTRILKASDVMKRTDEVISTKMSPKEAIDFLNSQKLSGSFVVDEVGHVAGYITADQLINSLNGNIQTVKGCPLESATTVGLEANLTKLSQLLWKTEHPIAVVDGDLLFQGLVGKTSIIKALASRGDEDHATENTISRLD